MSMIAPGLPASLPDGAPFRRFAPYLDAELRNGEVGHPCRVTEISAVGARVEVGDGVDDGAFAPELVIVIPSLGQYKARRGWRDGAEAAYLFELTAPSMRALDALMTDRFRT